MDGTYSTSRRSRDRAHRALHPGRAILLGVVGTIGLVAFPTIAQASSGSPERATQSSSSSICSKVSAAAVSHIVGYTLPAPATRTSKSTDKKLGVSMTVTDCTYGTDASLAALERDITLFYEVVSKPLPLSAIEEAIKSSPEPTGAQLKVTSYSGLGVPAWHLTLTESGITSEAIEGVKGTKLYGAVVYGKVTTSTLVALAKLALSSF